MSAVLETAPLGFPWPTIDPFLFCVHHDDAYPAGNEQFGPLGSLAGRNLGNDFVVKDGFRMYHGEVVPGFPQHPHRGFETVTLARRGYIDHSDSLGAAARFGRGDAQWLTTGGGIVHSEMFPLLSREEPNPVELFQIWLNLPGEDKLAQPHFAMLWEHEIPRHVVEDSAGKKVKLTTVAGAFAGKAPPPPPPKSWAARPDTDVAIWTLELEAGATFTIPRAQHPEALRTLYFFVGKTLQIDDRSLDSHSVAVVRSDVDLVLRAGSEACEVLMLQGRPIGEPVAQHGPFVMNSRAELQKAFEDYQRTRFGGWPWPADDPVHARDAGRFARHIDGRVEKVE
ncbi:MAG: pirin family protein [Myxococcales bacterium]|nr:MAG: pirin family protein [Myxococcales bacterium]